MSHISTSGTLVPSSIDGIYPGVVGFVIFYGATNLTKGIIVE